MYKESRKIHLIEEVLKVENESTLNELESIIKKSKKATHKGSIYDFVGVISTKDAKQMKKAIQETALVQASRLDLL